MKGGNGAGVVFKRRRFWPSIFWMLFLVCGAAAGCIFAFFPFFTAVLVAAFIGLNEFGRFKYRTNLTICALTSVVAVIAGTFSVAETASIFILFFAVSSYIFYFRDKSDGVTEAMSAFADKLSEAEDFDGVIEAAWSGMLEMAPERAAFIVLADIDNALYVPDHSGERGWELKRNGGVPWKVFASGRPLYVKKVQTSRDQPLDRDALSLISVPITSRKERLGVLQLEGGTVGAFDEEDISKLSLAAKIIGAELYGFTAETQNAKIGDREA